MFRGLYTATSGLMAHNRKQQILTNNLANASTPGFKQDQTVLRAFPEQLLSAMGKGTPAAGGSNKIGTLNTGVYAQEGIPSFLQGALKETGNSTDVALMSELLPVNPDTGQKGTIMYGVQTENGDIRYTQNGQFTVDQNGVLKTSDGHTVLGRDLSPINVGSEKFSIQDNGQISLENGTTAGSLWIGYTEDPAQLVKEGQGLLRWGGNPQNVPQSVEEVPLLANSASFVRQGFLEQSNVDLTQTMTEMMSTYRGFESNQKVIQAYDRSMEKAVNEIGRIY
ncbi:flagellar hook-basal body protein [Planococcus sp. YIM B11945]|uniref:flagellar hook-basal body protein n=1 Tax=Planococcus sp. YIM B11945 TaxID=3435410 RepID=UPI003D7D1EE3